MMFSYVQKDLLCSTTFFVFIRLINFLVFMAILQTMDVSGAVNKNV